MSYYYDNFILPFAVGAVVMFAIVAGKWFYWLYKLPKRDKGLISKGIFTKATFAAIGETVMESLIHRKIFRVNPRLGYMHMSLAFGWFLLIVVGWIEASVAFDGAPLHAHVFFRYFDPTMGGGNHILSNVMDVLLLFVLSGVALAWFKRVRSRALGMRRTTKHTAFDRIALSALWFIFPLRLVAESFMAAIKNNGGFLTGSIGSAISAGMNPELIVGLNQAAWWCYSICLGVFFVAMPFSRYMHIFTEVPLIFLRHYRLRSGEHETSFDNFQLQACSRCGICIDPCQLQSSAGINNVQSVYYVRDRRYGHLKDEVTDNCLMCGRCENICPVGLQLNTLRLNSREKQRNIPFDGRFNFLADVDRSQGTGKTGYFAGCMTLLTPAVLQSMDKIFRAAGEDVWWADKDGGVCCGRPLKLAGEIDAARKMMESNRNLFVKHGITTLVTSCPICLRVFKEDYALEGIEVLHHSEYILRLIKSGRLKLSADATKTFTYHDPCELGRGLGIYTQPREVIEAVGTLMEAAHSGKDALCCGSSVANTAINDEGQNKISSSLAGELDGVGAETIVTACPLCKKAIARNAKHRVADLSQVVAENFMIN